ncbi:MAG: hypothetical protein DCC75_02725 [Proteobacteria bacterium]|nr:MAG: hypothetical protein DCC75_02725 [Pseudomonadota bacterium]
MSSQVTLYIPCYNGARFLPGVLQAVRTQSRQPDELLVIDDGSKDDSAAIASSLGASVIQHNTNRGLAAARNTAILHAKFPVLASLDSDVVPDNKWLETLLECMLARKLTGVSGKVLECNHTRAVDGWRAEIMPLHYGDSYKENVRLFGANGVFEREALLTVLGYDESLRLAFDDMDICDRLLAGGYRTAYDPDALCYHQRSDTLASLARTVCNYRVPPLESIGVFDELQALVQAIIGTLIGDLKQLESFVAQQKFSHAMVSIYVTCALILQYFARYFRGSDASRDPRFLAALWLVMVSTLLRVQQMPHGLIQKLSDKLFADFGSAIMDLQQGMKVESLKEWTSRTLRGEITACLVELGWGGERHDMEPIAKVLAPLPNYLSYGSANWSELEQSFRQILSEE